MRGPRAAAGSTRLCQCIAHMLWLCTSWRWDAGDKTTGDRVNCQSNVISLCAADQLGWALALSGTLTMLGPDLSKLKKNSRA